MVLCRECKYYLSSESGVRCLAFGSSGYRSPIEGSRLKDVLSGSDCDLMKQKESTVISSGYAKPLGRDYGKLMVFHARLGSDLAAQYGHVLNYILSDMMDVCKYSVIAYVDPKATGLFSAFGRDCDVVRVELRNKSAGDDGMHAISKMVGYDRYSNLAMLLDCHGFYEGEGHSWYLTLRNFNNLEWVKS